MVTIFPTISLIVSLAAMVAMWRTPIENRPRHKLAAVARHKLAAVARHRRATVARNKQVAVGRHKPVAVLGRYLRQNQCRTRRALHQPQPFPALAGNRERKSAIPIAPTTVTLKASHLKITLHHRAVTDRIGSIHG
jgi:hypothetical protein